MSTMIRWGWPIATACGSIPFAGNRCGMWISACAARHILSRSSPRTASHDIAASWRCILRQIRCWSRTACGLRDLSPMPHSVAHRSQNMTAHSVGQRDVTMKRRSTLRLVLEDGGPGVCTFAINNACNARCGFCNFAFDKLPRDQWIFVTRQGALDALNILYAQGIRYLVITGGEPTMHPDLGDMIRHGSELDMKVMLVTNGSLLRPDR